MNYHMEQPESDSETNKALIARILGYPITAFTLVVAFAWNSAFQNWFSHHPKFKHHGPWIYAISITIACIIFITGLYFIQKTDRKCNRFGANKDEREAR